MQKSRWLKLVFLLSSSIGHSMSNGLVPHPEDPILSSVVAVYAYNHTSKLGNACSGTVIGPQTIITAAHCLEFEALPEGAEPEVEVFISSGVQPFKSLFAASRTHDTTRYARTKDFIPHPKYVSGARDHEHLGYDVGLVFLSSPQLLPVGLKPANLIYPYTLYQLPDRARVFGAGSGSTPAGAPVTLEEQQFLIGSFEIPKDVLKIMAAVDIQSPDQIEEGWLMNLNQPNSHFILTTPTHAQLLSGDSGSGLIQDYFGTPRLIGVYKGNLTINSRSAGHAFANLHEPALNRWVRSHLK